MQPSVQCNLVDFVMFIFYVYFITGSEINQFQHWLMHLNWGRTWGSKVSFVDNFCIGSKKRISF